MFGLLNFRNFVIDLPSMFLNNYPLLIQGYHCCPMCFYNPFAYRNLISMNAARFLLFAPFLSPVDYDSFSCGILCIPGSMHNYLYPNYTVQLS